MALFFSRSAKIDGSMVSRPIRVGGDIYPRRDDVDRLVEGGGFLRIPRPLQERFEPTMAGGWRTTSRAVSTKFGQTGRPYRKNLDFRNCVLDMCIASLSVSIYFIAVNLYFTPYIV